MKLDINSNIWKEVYNRIANNDEDFLVAAVANQTRWSRVDAALYLKHIYNIQIITDPDGRWEAVEFKDPSVITMILLKYRGEEHAID